MELHLSSPQALLQPSRHPLWMLHGKLLNSRWHQLQLPSLKYLLHRPLQTHMTMQHQIYSREAISKL
uniref:Csu631 n=1 Tax=Arundo donax TaxID=35708 RepID=A0A0A9CXQ4_ARUDO